MERAARPWRRLSIAAVVVAIGVVVTSVWLHYPATLPAEPLQGAAEPVTGDTVVSRSTPSEPVAHNPERARLEELRAMSETFRNTTFLIAIREAGYVCRELVSVYGGIADSTTWTAACREMLAYTVRVTHAGALLVEPTVQYFDALGPSPEPGPSVPQPVPVPQPR
jgi:hypothetical protein